MNKNLVRHRIRVLQSPNGHSACWRVCTQSGRLQLDEMVTKRYRLDEINEAYVDLVAGELIRGVIDFSISAQFVMDPVPPA